MEEGFWIPAFETWLEKAAVTVKLLCNDGQAIGAVSYGKSRDEKLPCWGEIVSLYLEPEFRGMGYGWQLMEEAVADLHQHNFHNIFLWVLEENMSARHFYERFDFTESEDKLIMEIAGKELTDIRYTLIK